MAQFCHPLIFWWEKRSKCEKILLIVLLFFFIITVYLSISLTTLTKTIQHKVCMSETCIRSAASTLEKIDRNVNPCDNFYKFACGNFAKKEMIPDQEVAISTLIALTGDVTLNLMNLYEEPIKDEDTHSLKILKTMYKSCMNTTKIEKENLDFLKNTFKEMGGWPVIEQDDWNEEKFDWINLLSYLQRNGLMKDECFIDIYVATDIKNSSKRILTITRPCSFHEMYKKGFNDPYVKAEYEYLTNLAMLFGANKIHATVEMKEVMEFVINMAQIPVPEKKMTSQSYFHNPMTIQQLQKNISSIPWLKLINNFLSPIDAYSSDDIINISQPDFIQGLEKLLSKTQKRVLANYMFVLIVSDAVTHLPEAFRIKQLEYYRIVFGKKQVTSRWKLCTNEMNKLHMAVSAIYIRTFVSNTTKVKMTELSLDIKSAFIENLNKITWMDNETREAALSKAKKMHFGIAYPDQILDNDTVEKYYEELEVAPGQNYLKIQSTLSLFFHKKHVKMLRTPIVKPDWHSQTYVYIVNAFYQHNENAIDIPAGILQGIMFDPDRPQYLNYGAIGSIVGHEMTHGYDDTGRQYDKDGNVFNWWKPETDVTFVNQSKCLEKQYENQYVPEIQMHINGKKTLGENIADNGGFKMAYQSYLKWQQRNSPEYALPGLEFSPRQLFWIAAAQTWCSKYKKETVKYLITADVHAPHEFRVVVSFMNSDDFARDFNCKLGTPMNPKHKCSIW